MSKVYVFISVCVGGKRTLMAQSGGLGPQGRACIKCGILTADMVNGSKNKGNCLPNVVYVIYFIAEGQ